MGRANDQAEAAQDEIDRLDELVARLVDERRYADRLLDRMTDRLIERLSKVDRPDERRYAERLAHRMGDRLIERLHDRLIEAERQVIEAERRMIEAQRLVIEAERLAKLKASIRPALHLDGLDRYHGAGALVMTAGSVGMVLASLLTFGPLWAGFLAGAVPTLFLAALVHPEHA